MNTKAEDAAVRAAELKIAEILSALEEQTGAIVHDLSVGDFEITAVNDVRPQILRRVQVSMKRRPGTRWQTV